ncbi:MAG: dTDP-4-dehydrorhamnose reductase [Ferruginibacter sp.]
MSLKKNILVTGADGQLGMEFRDLEKTFPYFNFYFVSRTDLSITDNQALENYFANAKIDVCINCAAYTAVDKAETEMDAAMQVNAVGAANVALVCSMYETKLFHISTDYVFDGKAGKPYKETDMVNPVGAYGLTKLAGEKAVQDAHSSAIIIRTSWVYSSHGKNFVKTMVRLMQEKESIGVVNDQFGSPTYAADLALAIMHIIEADDFVPGIYHYCNEGVISWYEFATAIKSFLQSTCKVNAIPTAEYPTPAARPAYSALNTERFFQTFGIAIPGWKESLQKCLREFTAAEQGKL